MNVNNKIPLSYYKYVFNLNPRFKNNSLINLFFHFYNSIVYYEHLMMS